MKFHHCRARASFSRFADRGVDMGVLSVPQSSNSTSKVVMTCTAYRNETGLRSLDAKSGPLKLASCGSNISAGMLDIA